MIRQTLTFLTSVMVFAVALSSPAAANQTRTLTDFSEVELSWRSVNDNVMGGVSKGAYEVDRGILTFEGRTSLDNNGGFASIRSDRRPLELEGFDGLAVRVRGDGRTYLLTLQTAATGRWISYWTRFDTRPGEWIDLRIGFDEFYPTTFGRKLPGPSLDVAEINSLGFMIYDKKAGPFALEVDRVVAYQGDAAISNEEANDIVSRAAAAGNFETLVKAVEAAGLSATLGDSGPFTVLAPGDEAFAALPDGTLEKLLEAGSQDRLRQILGYHVIEGRLSLEDLVSAGTIGTLAGQRLQVRVESGRISVGEAQLVTAGIDCSNGVIYVIDQVLAPDGRTVVEAAQELGQLETLLAAARAAGLLETLSGTGPLTLLAPTDEAFSALPEGALEALLKPERRADLRAVLERHVVSKRIYTDEMLSVGSVTALDGAELQVAFGEQLRIGGAAVKSGDLDLANGVVHVIDRVILPEGLDLTADNAPAPEQDASTDPDRRARALIALAIDRGVPLYNGGQPGACRAVYEVAAAALLSNGELSLDGESRAALTEALQHEGSEEQRAWALRRALDQAFAALSFD